MNVYACVPIKLYLQRQEVSSLLLFLFLSPFPSLNISFFSSFFSNFSSSPLLFPLFPFLSYISSLSFFCQYLTWKDFVLIIRERKKSDICLVIKNLISLVGGRSPKGTWRKKVRTQRKSCCRPPQAWAHLDLFHSLFRSSDRWIFPVTVLGRSKTNSIFRGYL